MYITASLLITACTHNACAKDNAHNEYNIKAAFLYNFASFVEWPSSTFADTSTPITIGVIGDDPFGSILDDAIRSKTINGRRLQIKRYKRRQDAEYCNIIFICSSEQRHFTNIVENPKLAKSLTVSEIDKFAQRGGIIRFTMQDNKVALEINPDTAQKASIKISSKLMKLAKVVNN